MVASVHAWPRSPRPTLGVDGTRQLRRLRRCHRWAAGLQLLGWGVGLVSLSAVPPGFRRQLFIGMLLVGAQALLTELGAHMLTRLALRPTLAPVGEDEVLRLGRWLLWFSVLLTLGTWTWAAAAALAGYVAVFG